MDTRLELFRGYFDRLDPAARPARALREELYVDPPGRAVSAQLAARLQLAPTSAHLVVGGIGSGKTTQLLRAAEILRETGDTIAVYVDVARRHDIDKDLVGVLIVLAGLELCKHVGVSPDPAVKDICEQFKRWADGHTEFVPYDPSDDLDDGSWVPPDDEPGHFVRHAGVLSRPLPPLPAGMKERIEAVRRLREALPDGIRHFSVLFDSLDRLDDVEMFRKAALEDLRALRQAGVGLVVVGPGRIVYGANRPIVDLFDGQLHTVPASDVAKNDAARAFFDRVLAKRTDETVLGENARDKLIRASGGILRDLLALARLAVEEAFLAGVDSVGDEQVARAIDQFGRSLMIGLRQGELHTLQRLRLRGTFVPTDDTELALLVSRRVIEYQGVTQRYSVHPTIDPLLASLESKR